MRSGANFRSPLQEDCDFQVELFRSLGPCFSQRLSRLGPLRLSSDLKEGAVGQDLTSVARALKLFPSIPASLKVALVTPSHLVALSSSGAEFDLWYSKVSTLRVPHDACYIHLGAGLGHDLVMHATKISSGDASFFAVDASEVSLNAARHNCARHNWSVLLPDREP